MLSSMNLLHKINCVTPSHNKKCAMANLNVTFWKCENGVLTLDIPNKDSYFQFSQDRLLECVRGDLDLDEFIFYIEKILTVYKHMV